MTYTLARLPIPRPLWDLIAAKLRAAGYDHVFHEGMIDMTHIGLEVDPAAKGWAELLAAHAPAKVASGFAPVFERVGSCGQPAKVEIRPLGDSSPDGYTHACAAHVVDMFGVRDGEPEPSAYEVRELAGEEVEGPPALVCCHITPPRAPEPDGILTTGAPAIGAAP